MSKKNLVIKLLLNPRVRRFAIGVLKDPCIRRVIVKLIARQLPAGKTKGSALNAQPGSCEGLAKPFQES